jgi:hypothetical protein
MQPAAHRKLQRSPFFPGLPDQQITSQLIYHIWWSKSLTDSYKWVWHSLTPTSSPLDFCHPFLYYWSNLYLLILSIFIAPNFLVKSLILQMILSCQASVNLSGRWSLESCLIFSRLKCFGTMLLHVIIIYQCRKAVSIDIATLLLFSASHVQLARKIAAQTIHNHDKWQLHPWWRWCYQYWTQRFQCCSY